jgi:hypothetical protein
MQLYTTVPHYASCNGQYVVNNPQAIGMGDSIDGKFKPPPPLPPPDDVYGSPFGPLGSTTYIAQYYRASSSVGRASGLSCNGSMPDGMMQMPWNLIQSQVTGQQRALVDAEGNPLSQMEQKDGQTTMKEFFEQVQLSPLGGHLAIWGPGESVCG